MGSKLTVHPAVPTMPGSSDPSSLVSLDSYSIYQSHVPHTPNSSFIAIAASATLFNPLFNSTFMDGRFSSLPWGVPYKLPVAVYLPGIGKGAPVQVARVVTRPFGFISGASETKVTMGGELVSVVGGKSVESKRVKDALSGFVERYLAGENSTILVRYDSAPSAPAPDDTALFPPDLIVPVIDNVTVPLTFPGTTSKMELFKNLRIEDMKIRLSSLLKSHDQTDPDDEGDLLCSGRVVGELALPDEFEGLGDAIGVESIWPDVFVYDGDLPHESINVDPSSQLVLGGSATTQSYPPSPVPLNAFGRLHPSSSITASTTHFPRNSTHNSTTLITATFVDAPMWLIPGREDVFRRFVSKIIFGGSNARVRASVRGVSAVEVQLGGWGEIGLEGLPIEGSFMVGRGGISSVEHV
jgi:hypothetical protein